MAVLFLLVSFMIQPFHRALANELSADEVVPPTPVAEDVKIELDDVVTESAVEEVEAKAEPVADIPPVDDEVLLDDPASDREIETILPPENSELIDESLIDDPPEELHESDVSFNDGVEEYIEPPPEIPPPEIVAETSSSADSEVTENIPIPEVELSTSASELTDVSTTSVQTDMPDPPDLATADSGYLSVSELSEPESGGETVSEVASSTIDVVADIATPTTDSSTLGVEDAAPPAVDNAGVGGGSEGSGGGDDGPTDNPLPDTSVVDNNEGGGSLEVADVPSGSVSEEGSAGDAVESGSTSGILEELVPAEPEMVIQAQYLVTEENYYQFSQQSCVAVGDGTYHCTLNGGNSIDEHAVVYADNDEEGDMEIYIKTSKDKIEKLSDNQFDDTSPHFNAESMTVVWQRLVDGRYQIVSYDLSEGKETQLTFSRTNNMEPKVSVDGIAWQAWDGNDWEIMYFDGTYTDQITDNDTQDVTPVIEDGYILWSILGGENQEAKVYSLESGEVMTITDHDGGAIENPRFMLVYDTKFDNGDVVTQGFDPETGLSSQISAQPYSEPINIPPVDTTGEIKALIQNKSTQKEESSSDGVVSGSDSLVGDSDYDSTTSGSTDSLNLRSDISQADSLDIETNSGSVVSETPLELTEFDLVITSSTTPSGETEVSTTSSGIALSTQD